MTNDDFNRPLGRDVEPMTPPDDGMSWAVPAVVLAIVLIVGALFYANSSGGDRTAALNDRTSSAPAPSPSPPAPTR